MTETIWPVEPEIFTAWPFTEIAGHPLLEDQREPALTAGMRKAIGCP